MNMAYTISFTLNGKAVKLEVEAKEILVDTLRERLGLTGTKKSCGTGDCGACTVLLNGRAVRSCTMLTAMIDGKEVLTIEGLGGADKVHPIQQAFVDEGAIQCGYCIPGMILATKALLDKNQNPTTDEIREALSGNLCRCTGYEKIIRAVERAARTLRG